MDRPPAAPLHVSGTARRAVPFHMFSRLELTRCGCIKPEAAAETVSNQFKWEGLPCQWILQTVRP